jgi:hypothetical protein
MRRFFTSCIGSVHQRSQLQQCGSKGIGSMGGALRGHPLLSVKAEAVAAALHGSPQDSDDDHHHHHQTDEQLHFLDRVMNAFLYFQN